jgi:hypothetical protein
MPLWSRMPIAQVQAPPIPSRGAGVFDPFHVTGTMLNGKPTGEVWNGINSNNVVGSSEGWKARSASNVSAGALGQAR